MSDRQQLVEVLSTAFADDPVFLYMFPPDVTRREARLRGFFQLEVPRSARLGGAWRTDDGAGAAIWYPPGQWQASPWQGLLQMPAWMRVFGRQLALAGRALMTMQAQHPHQPHWYLYYLATRPSHQGTGIGSALLRPILRRCDDQRLPAYLEATSQRNRALYLRHGFVDRDAYALPNGPTLYPMWREPHTATSDDRADVTPSTSR